MNRVGRIEFRVRHSRGQSWAVDRIHWWSDSYYVKEGRSRYFPTKSMAESAMRRMKSREEYRQMRAQRKALKEEV